MKKTTLAIIAMFLSLLMIVEAAPLYAIAEGLISDEAVESEQYPLIEDNVEENKAYIVGEDTSKREENTKIFRMSDGSYTAAVYPVQIHYEEDGEMKEIDNTLQTTDGGFVTVKGPVTVGLPDSFDEGRSVEYSNGEHSVSFMLDTEKKAKGTRISKEKKKDRLKELEEIIALERLDDEAFEKAYGKKKHQSEFYGYDEKSAIEEHTSLTMTNDKLGSQITYRGVFEDVDLKYTVSGTMLKEEIILNSAAGILNKYEFIIASDTLVPNLAEDGAVQFCDGEGKAVFEINAPHMYDAAGEISYEIGVKLKENSDGSYTYTLNPDNNWLGDEARVYPIVIDPPVNESNTHSIKDTTGYFATSASHDPTTIFIGQKEGAVEAQGMLYSAIPADIKYGTTKIINASLILWRTADDHINDKLRINAYRITSDWNTANVNEDSVIYLGTNGRANYSDVLDYVDITDTDNLDDKYTYTWDITEAAEEWLSGEIPNYGIALRADSVTSGVNNHASFVDSTTFYGNTDANVNGCPQFIYTYRDLKGIEDYWSFTSMTAGRFGSIGVNNYNGNPVMTQSLVSSTGNNMPVSLSLIYSYNSLDDGKSGFADWRTNYHMMIEPCDETFSVGSTELAKYKYVFIDSDGTRHYLKEEGSEYKDEDGLGLTLTVINETDYKYQIETKGKTVYKFDYAGRLNRIIDSNGNFNHIYFTNATERKIDRIVEGSDMSGTRRTTTIAYNEWNNTITTPEGQQVIVSFTYTTKDCIFGFFYEDSDGATREGATRFEFDSTNFPTAVYDGYGHKTTITGATSNGVKRVTNMSWGTEEENLQTYTFAYDHNYTKITDIDGRAATYQFNNYGQTVGVVDHTTSWGQNYEFGVQNGQNEGYENKLLLASKTIAPALNRALDPGFGEESSAARYAVTPAASTMTGSYDSTRGNTGPGSMKVTKSAGDTAASFIYQTISGLSVGNYTVSLFVNTKTEGAISGAGVRAQATVQNANGYRTSSGSAILTTTETDEWIRLQATVDVVSGDTTLSFGLLFTEGTYGTIYVDDIQIEYNVCGGGAGDNLSGAGSFNLLEDSSFDLSATNTRWGASGFASAGRPSDAPRVVSRIYIANGDSDTVKTVRQTVYMNGNEGDIFIAGGWAKVNSVPLNGEHKSKDPMATVKVIFYDDVIPRGSYSVKCNTEVETWQYLMTKIVAPTDYTKIVYEFDYSYNCGTASFATPFLYKESYGQSYKYDENGNLVSTTDVAETMATFAYQDDILCSSISPSGSQYLYTNDEETGNTIYAYSDMGQKIDFTYNQSGDATGMSITDAPLISTPLDPSNVAYYIVNAKTGRALTQYGNYAASAPFKRYEIQKWILYPLTSGITTVRTLSDRSVALKTVDTGTSTYHSTETINSETSIYAEYKFKFMYENDGTYKILTGESGYENCLRMSDADYEKGYYKVTASEPYDKDDLANKWYLIQVSTSLKIGTSATYSADGNYLTSSTDQYGNTTRYTYTTGGMVDVITDPKGNTTDYDYDSMNRTVKVCTALNQNVVEYFYEGDDLSQIKVDGGEVNYFFDYDEFGRTYDIFVGTESRTQRLVRNYYDGDVLDYQRYGNSETIDFTYDSLDRLTEKKYSYNSETVEYYYNSNGDLYKIRDGMAGTTTVYTYDLAGRQVGSYVTDLSGGNVIANSTTKYSSTVGVTTAHTVTIYDESNGAASNVDYGYWYGGLGKSMELLSELQMNDTFFWYDYDKLGRMTARKTTIGSDDGDPVSIRIDAGLRETYTYLDAAASGYTTTLVSTHTDLLGAVHTYYYDANGNINMEIIEDGSTTEYKSYLYDDLNRMTRYNDSALDLTMIYTYDDRGNILSYTMYEYSAYSNPVNESTADTYTYGYADTTWKDLLTSFNGTEIDYDQIGNPDNWTQGRTFTWSNARMLTGIQFITGDPISYTYDGDGLRTGKAGRRNTQYYIVDGQYVGEKTTISGVEYLITYLYGDNGIAGINVNGEDYYFVKNIQGDVIAILYADGTLLATYEYDAYGYFYAARNSRGTKITSQSNVANLNPFRYRGYIYDQETGFYYLRSRYYDPEVGRFLNADGYVSTGQGFDGNNMFAYCSNNPINRKDPFGDKDYIYTSQTEYYIENDWGFFEFLHSDRYFVEVDSKRYRANSKETVTLYDWKSVDRDFLGDTFNNLIDEANKKKTNLIRVFTQSVGGELDFKLKLSKDKLYLINSVVYNRNETGNFMWAYFLESHGFNGYFSGALAQGGSLFGATPRFDESWDVAARWAGVQYFYTSIDKKWLFNARY